MRQGPRCANPWLAPPAGGRVTSGGWCSAPTVREPSTAVGSPPTTVCLFLRLGLRLCLCLRLRLCCCLGLCVCISVCLCLCVCVCIDLCLCLCFCLGPGRVGTSQSVPRSGHNSPPPSHSPFEKRRGPRVTCGKGVEGGAVRATPHTARSPCHQPQSRSRPLVRPILVNFGPPSQPLWADFRQYWPFLGRQDARFRSNLERQLGSSWLTQGGKHGQFRSNWRRSVGQFWLISGHTLLISPLKIMSPSKVISRYRAPRKLWMRDLL